MKDDAIFVAVGDVIKEMRNEILAEVEALGHAKPDQLFKSVMARRLENAKFTLADFSTAFIHKQTSASRGKSTDYHSGQIPEVFRKMING